MDVKTGLLILGEFALLGAVILAAQKEKTLRALERAAAKRLLAVYKKRAAAKELARRRKINQKAVYVPVRPPEKQNEEQAA